MRLWCLAAHGESAARRGRAPRAAACASARAGELDGDVACQSVSQCGSVNSELSAVTGVAVRMHLSLKMWALQ
jgi:hypothetical protein